MKTVSVEPSTFDLLQAWVATNPGLAVFAGAAIFGVLCLDGETRRQILPF